MKFWIENGVRKRALRYFNTKEESFVAFKELWQRAYGKFPNNNLASKYTGNDSPHTWLGNLRNAYCSQVKDHNC